MDDNKPKPSLHDRLKHKSFKKTPHSNKSNLALLQSQLNEKNLQCQNLLDSLQRTMAEFDNYRKRSEKEKLNLYGNAVADTIEKILPIIDNLERALNSIDDKNSNYYKGIDLVLKQFFSILSEFGVESIKINPGDDFNHDLHCAIAHIDDENYGENKIVDELQKGYTYKDKVIRYSQVRVAN